MKNRFFLYKSILFFIALGFFLISCRGRSAGNLDDWDDHFLLPPRGFAAAQNVPIYDILEQIEWIGALDLGEALELDREALGLEQIPEKGVHFEPRVEYVDDESVYFIPVRNERFRGWINIYCYAPEDARIGVALAGSSLGSAFVFPPQNSKNTGYFSYATLTGSDIISFNQNDVEAAKLLARARGTRSRERAAEYLNQAAAAYPSGSLRLLIEELLRPGTVPADREKLAAWFSVTEDNTPVYEEPDFSSPVIAQLEQYAEVEIAERTTGQAETRTGAARWYHLAGPAEGGWVFGLNLEGAD
ncbi:MAG: hypothetical protein LBJ24_00035 [Treponema sp.]|jgi:hypothetical protein|nr:hypothetical protein [Treponema sp.]